MVCSCGRNYNPVERRGKTGRVSSKGAQKITKSSLQSNNMHNSGDHVGQNKASGYIDKPLLNSSS